MSGLVHRFHNVLANRAWPIRLALTLCGLLGVTSPGAAGAAEPCDAKQGCALVDGRYFVYRPLAEPRGALMFFHGYGSNARHELQTPALRNWAENHGFVLLIPDGIEARWAVIDGIPGARDEIAFARSVLTDARERLSLAKLPVFASGFSLGASMVWKLACTGMPDFAGYIAFSGAFWEPAPDACRPLAAPLLHFHGENDTVVPLEGRQLRSGRRQAPLEKALLAMSRAATCAPPPRQDTIVTSPPALACADRLECAGGAISYCGHGLGHNFEVDWLSFALSHLKPSVTRSDR